MNLLAGNAWGLWQNLCRQGIVCGRRRCRGCLETTGKTGAVIGLGWNAAGGGDHGQHRTLLAELVPSWDCVGIYLPTAPAFPVLPVMEMLPDLRSRGNTCRGGPDVSFLGSCGDACGGFPSIPCQEMLPYYSLLGIACGNLPCGTCIPNIPCQGMTAEESQKFPARECLPKNPQHPLRQMMPSAAACGGCCGLLPTGGFFP